MIIEVILREDPIQNTPKAALCHFFATPVAHLAGILKQGCPWRVFSMGSISLLTPLPKIIVAESIHLCCID